VIPPQSADGAGAPRGDASGGAVVERFGEALRGADTSPAGPEETSKSLLYRASEGEPEAWQRLVDLYQPMIQGWLNRFCVQRQEADDLTQDVLAILIRRFKDFSHAGHRGAFRGWLRTVTANRAREFWRAGKLRARVAGGDEFLEMIAQIEDPNSALSREWDAQHDAHLLRKLLAMMEEEFEPATIRVFRLLVIEGASASAVAAEQGMTIAAVYGAKSRVLQRLRQVARGILD
jgi:RNA polymerase sigma factor (sigma-70 family)